MDFDWSAEQKAARDKLAHMLRGDTRAGLANLEAESDPGRLRFLTGDWLRRLATTGYLGLDATSGALTLLAAQEELARASGSLFLATETSVRLFGGLVAAHARPELRDDLLPRVLHGDVVGAVAVTEREGGTVPALGFATEARPDGNDVLLSGHKPFVTNGPIADWIAVAGRLEGKRAFFLLPRDSSGEIQERRVRVLGYDGLAVGGLELRDVRVPRGNVLGPFDDDAPFMALRRTEDLVLAMVAVGLLQRTLDAAREHAKRHNRDGRPIGKYQEVSFALAEMLTLGQTARLLCCRAAWHVATGAAEASVLVHCAKVFAAETAEKVASMALQITAGDGYVRGNPVEKAWREVKYPSIAGTTSQRARMAIADALLARY